MQTVTRKCDCCEKVLTELVSKKEEPFKQDWCSLRWIEVTYNNKLFHFCSKKCLEQGADIIG